MLRLFGVFEYYDGKNCFWGDVLCRDKDGKFLLFVLRSHAQAALDALPKLADATYEVLPVEVR